MNLEPRGAAADEGPPISMRDATLADAGPIATINQASWEHAYRGLVPDSFLDSFSFAERLERWHERLSQPSPRLRTLVATQADALLGYCALALPARDDDADSGTAEIVAIYVTPERIRRGVGSALIRAALDVIASGEWKSVTLWVFSDNHAARSFYARVGFVADGKVTRHPTVGLEEMRLRLALAR